MLEGQVWVGGGCADPMGPRPQAGSPVAGVGVGWGILGVSHKVGSKDSNGHRVDTQGSLLTEASKDSLEAEVQGHRRLGVPEVPVEAKDRKSGNRWQGHLTVIILSCFVWRSLGGTDEGLRAARGQQQGPPGKGGGGKRQKLAAAGSERPNSHREVDKLDMKRWEESYIVKVAAQHLGPWKPFSNNINSNSNRSKCFPKFMLEHFLGVILTTLPRASVTPHSNSRSRLQQTGGWTGHPESYC